MFSLAYKNVEKNKQKHGDTPWQKQRGYFDQRNYIEKSTCKQVRFFDHLNYIEKGTWKQTWISRPAKLH